MIESGDIVYSKDIATRHNTKLGGIRLKLKKPVILMLLGQIHNDKQEAPTQANIELMLAEIGWFSGNMLVNFMGKKEWDEFCEFAKNRLKV